MTVAANDSMMPANKNACFLHCIHWLWAPMEAARLPIRLFASKLALWDCSSRNIQLQDPCWSKTDGFNQRNPSPEIPTGLLPGKTSSCKLFKLWRSVRHTPETAARSFGVWTSHPSQAQRDVVVVSCRPCERSCWTGPRSLPRSRHGCHAFNW